MISLQKWDELKALLKEKGINEEDLVEQFVLGSGRGGQKVNTSHSTVHLKHLPSGIEVKCNKERSRDGNRFFARRLLLEKYRREVLNEITPSAEKELRKAKQKKRRARRSKEKDS